MGGWRDEDVPQSRGMETEDTALHAANRGWLRDRDGFGVMPGDDEGLAALAKRIAAPATGR